MWLSYSLINFQNTGELSQTRYSIDNKTEETWHDQQEDKDKDNNTRSNMYIWSRQIWSIGVSLKRSCKMQFRRVGLRSIGPSSQKL